MALSDVRRLEAVDLQLLSDDSIEITGLRFTEHSYTGGVLTLDGAGGLVSLNLAFQPQLAPPTEQTGTRSPLISTATMRRV
jgi:hypothetical protein